MTTFTTPAPKPVRVIKITQAESGSRQIKFDAMPAVVEALRQHSLGTILGDASAGKWTLKVNELYDFAQILDWLQRLEGEM